jgi:hypothetical protein
MVQYHDSLEWSISESGLKRTSVFPVSVFHGRPLAYSIESYILKICSSAKLDDSVVIVAAVYLSRIIEKVGGELPVSSCTVHRLLLAALTIAAKFVLDHPRSNKVMAACADLPISKFNQLEVRFLCAIQYELAVSPADIAIAKDALPSCDDAPVCKKFKADVFHDNSNQSSSVRGVAACNNSTESDGVENNNYNDLGGQQEEVSTTQNPRGVLSMEKEVATKNYMNEAADGVNGLAASPEWSEASGYASGCEASGFSSAPLDGIQNVCDEPKGSYTSVLPPIPESTKMSTPERRGNYSMALVAIAS